MATIIKNLKKYYQVFLAFPVLLIISVSCTDIEGDGIDTMVWEGATLPEESSYRNPVWEPDLSNPSVFRGATQFFAFGDEKEWSKGLNYVVPVLRSNNLMNWSLAGEAFELRPDWAEGIISGVSAVFSRTLSTYYIAYAIGENGIGTAWSRAPQGPYVDYGQLINPADLGFTKCTNPFFIQAGLKFYLFFDTNDGVYGVELTIVRNSAPHITGSSFKIAGQEFSGVHILRKSASLHYLFASSGNGEDVKIKVGKATNITGPYLDKEGNNLLEGFGTDLIISNPDHSIIAPSNVGGTFSDFENNDWILYQARDNSKPELTGGGERNPMFLNRIEWDENGWPSQTIEVGKGWQTPKYVMSN